MPSFGELSKIVLKAVTPSFLSKNPHFNFITVHYFWVISMSIVGSILIFASGRGNVAYVDALFFASGSNTQAGLNTVDVNLLNTFQQVVIFLMAMMSNPITIHSSVVFLRLYWFEKRFQHVVREATARRGTMSKSKAKTQPDIADVERGVNGRNITVMHNTAKHTRMTNDGILLEDPPEENGAFKPGNGSVSDDSIDPMSQVSHRDQDASEQPTQQMQQPQIKFAEKVVRSDDQEEDIKLPPKLTEEEHIAILQRQRALSEDGEILRIPGPRDADRGMGPETVDEEIEGPAELGRLARYRRGSSLDGPQPLPSRGEDRQQTIKIAEPQRPSKHEIAEDVEAAAHAVGVLKFRRPRRNGEKLHRADTAGTSFTLARTRTANTLNRVKSAFTGEKEKEMPYLSWQPTLGRNSAFLGLTEEQREELGGIEYRSLKTLAVILAIYFWGYWIFGIICLLPWILHTDYYGVIVDQAGQSRTWWGIFTANSAFMDLGFTLTPDSMIYFNTAIWPLLLMSFLIIIGNTGFPIMLRFMVWLASLVTPRGSGLWEELRFLLDHPRRCFTLLFPGPATWWLFLILVILNGVDLIFFIILDLGRGKIAEMALNIRFLVGWFQAASTRTAGFAALNLADLHPAVQASYLIMMYISVFPIAISIRRTNVYEEKSLGIYATNAQEIEDDANSGGFSYVGAHLRRQLSFDLWYIFIGFFIMTISEGNHILDGNVSMFAILFEIVSAYGTVGLSLGFPNVNASLCSQFSVIGKLVLIAMQIRGRHRGLPYGLDRAVLLPSESLNRKEAEEAERRLQRRNSNVSDLNAEGIGLTSSMSRGRSRSVDRRNVIARMLHPGPAFPHTHSMTKMDTRQTNQTSHTHQPSLTLRRTTSDPLNEEAEADVYDDQARQRPRRSSTAPMHMHNRSGSNVKPAA